jgi:hypothetical protein
VNNEIKLHEPGKTIYIFKEDLDYFGYQNNCSNYEGLKYILLPLD